MVLGLTRPMLHGIFHGFFSSSAIHTTFASFHFLTPSTCLNGEEAYPQTPFI